MNPTISNNGRPPIVVPPIAPGTPSAEALRDVRAANLNAATVTYTFGDNVYNSIQELLDAERVNLPGYTFNPETNAFERPPQYTLTLGDESLSFATQDALIQYGTENGLGEWDPKTRQFITPAKPEQVSVTLGNETFVAPNAADLFERLRATLPAGTTLAQGDNGQVFFQTPNQFSFTLNPGSTNEEKLTFNTRQEMIDAGQARGLGTFDPATNRFVKPAEPGDVTLGETNFRVNVASVRTQPSQGVTSGVIGDRLNEEDFSEFTDPSVIQTEAFNAVRNLNGRSGLNSGTPVTQITGDAIQVMIPNGSKVMFFSERENAGANAQSVNIDALVATLNGDTLTYDQFNANKNAPVTSVVNNPNRAILLTDGEKVVAVFGDGREPVVLTPEQIERLPKAPNGKPGLIEQTDNAADVELQPLPPGQTIPTIEVDGEKIPLDKIPGIPGLTTPTGFEDGDKKPIGENRQPVEFFVTPRTEEDSSYRPEVPTTPVGEWTGFAQLYSILLTADTQTPVEQGATSPAAIVASNRVGTGPGVNGTVPNPFSPQNTIGTQQTLTGERVIPLLTREMVEQLDPEVVGTVVSPTVSYYGIDNGAVDAAGNPTGGSFFIALPEGVDTTSDSFLRTQQNIARRNGRSMLDFATALAGRYDSSAIWVPQNIGPNAQGRHVTIEGEVVTLQPDERFSDVAAVILRPDANGKVQAYALTYENMAQYSPDALNTSISTPEELHRRGIPMEALTLLSPEDVERLANNRLYQEVSNAQGAGIGLQGGGAEPRPIAYPPNLPAAVPTAE